MERAIGDALNRLDLRSLIAGKLVAVKPNETWASARDRKGDFICRPLTLPCDRRRLAPMSIDDSVNILLIDGIDMDRQYYAQRLTVISPDYQIL